MIPDLHSLEGPDSYSERCLRNTAASSLPNHLSAEYFLSQLGSEAGEVLGKFAKLARDRGISMESALRELTDEEFEPIYHELGDVLFQLTMIARIRGKSLQDLASFNCIKLDRREANGTISGSGDDR